MDNYTSWFTPDRDGKIRINSILIYKSLSSQIITKLDSNTSVNEIVRWIKHETIEAFKIKYKKQPEVGALNNASGRWNEFLATSLLSEIVVDLNIENKLCIIIFSLPNSQVQSNKDIAYSKFIGLFHKNEIDTKQALSKIEPFQNNIFLPSPDYIIAVLNQESIFTQVQRLLKAQVREPDSLALYDLLKGRLHLAEVKAAISLKTSNCSDRRYQPLFEAAMIKAISHLLEQNWRYYMVVSELTDADRTIFCQAIAPHGIALRQNFSLVDGTYLYNRKADLIPLVEAAIKVS
ncbi:Cfr10I/Bse634I family restriction endonuclease [Chroococcidiopsidales cyanobacterium LEGE 13417]|nr:Cfr10I/Bse634I family restriction endonuclease [Chroococcidiopsidales cyanobacterium LEGE 13417]